MLAFLLAIDRRLSRILTFLGCVAMAILASVCLAQVFSRFVLETPTVWSEALARTLMVWSVFLGMPVTLRRGRAIAMSFLADMAPPRMKIVLNVIVVGAITFALIIMLWQGVLLLERISNQRMAGLDIPIIWAYAAIPVGAFLSLIALTFSCVEQVREGRAPSPPFEGDAI